MFDRWFDSWRWALCVLSGLLLAASFAPFSSPTCGWIALVPAWWVLSRSEKVRRSPMRYGYVLGLVFFGAIFWWISNVTVIGTVILIFYLALFPAFWFLFVARLVRRHESDVRIIINAFEAAALWVMLEWWRDWFLTGFNWNELGVSQAPSIVFRQLAAFGGVHLISFVLVLVNILWAEGLLSMARTLKEKRVVRASVPFAAALFLVAIAFAAGCLHLRRAHGEGTRLNFACVQPNIPQIQYDGGPIEQYRITERKALEKAEQLSADALSVSPKPRLLIWPEAFTGQEIFGRGILGEIVREISTSSGGYFLVGSQDSDPEHVYNTAYLYGPGGDAYQFYRKTHLVMLGEYIPLGDVLPKFHDWLRDQAGVGTDMTPGPGPVVFSMVDPNLRLAPLICFEDTLPDVANKAAPLNPNFFVTITNDGWYTGWCAAWGVRQHLANAIFRCVEHDRPMIRCANTGISCVVDENGSVVSRYRDEVGREIDVGGVFRGVLTCAPPQGTLYEQRGDWIILISAIGTAMLGIRLFKRAQAK